METERFLEFEETKNWHNFAACKGTDTELFYPERGDSVRTVLNTCEECSVTFDCLEYALANNETVGVWGATTPKGRLPRNLERVVAQIVERKWHRSEERVEVKVIKKGRRAV